MPEIREALERGLKLHLAGDRASAELIYRQVLGQQPQQPDALHLLGMALMQRGRLNEAVPLLEQAVRVDAGYAEFHWHLGVAYLNSQRYDEACAALMRATQLAPRAPEAHYDLGLALYNLGRMHEAEASYRRAIDCQPADPRARTNLGNLLLELGQVDEALAQLEAALVIDPRLPAAHYNRGLALLKLGRLAEGWEEYEWRWCTPESSQGKRSEPVWDGTPTEGVVLLHCEQGLGDTIQLIRYLPLVRERCPSAIVAVQRALLPLLTQSGTRGLVAEGAAPRCDFQLPLASLPRVMGTTLETIPADIPYLHPRPDLVTQWREQLAPVGGFKVGIAWQGSTGYREDRHRSIPLQMFAPLAAVPDVRLISLQKGAGAEQLVPMRSQFQVIDWMDQADTVAGPLMDTAAIVRGLDLVITSDTSIAHLAGAMGAPVWVALKIGPDWRWRAAGESSPWYPTMRLFRQRAFHDWPQVFRDLASALQSLVQAST